MDEKNNLPEEQTPHTESVETNAPSPKIPVPKAPVPKLPFIIGGVVAGVVAISVTVALILGGGNIAVCKHDDPSKIVAVDAVAPTCMETGLTKGMKCTACGTMVVPQTIYPVRDCIAGAWIVDYDATHIEDGMRHAECTMCGRIVKEDVILSGQKKMVYTLLSDNTYEVGELGGCRDTEIIIPSEYNGLPVTSIGVGAFSCCSNLSSVVIPDSVTSIGDEAFSCCSNLSSVVIGDSVTSIGEGAFSNCASLASIVIPDSVTSIGEGAFSCCSGLTNITVNEGNKYYKSIDGNLYTKDEKTLIQYAIGKQDKSFVVPDSVTSIGFAAFYYCSRLSSVVIGDSVTSIGDSAFGWCYSLTSVVIGDSVTSIGNYAFLGCSSLSSIVIPDSVTYIGEYAFAVCSSLTSVVIPDSVTYIDKYAFHGCSSIKDVYYTGSKAEWKAITIGSYNSLLANATIHYNYVPEN